MIPQKVGIMNHSSLIDELITHKHGINLHLIIFDQLMWY